MTSPRSILRALFLAAFALFLAVPAQAQKNGNKARPFPEFGFEFKPLRDWTDVPIRDDRASIGVIGNLSAERGVQVKMEGNVVRPFSPSLLVIKLDPQVAVTGDTEDGDPEGGGGLRGRVGREAPKEKTSNQLVLDFLGGNLRADEFRTVVPEIDDEFKAKAIVGKREEFETFFVSTNAAFDLLIDVYTFQLPDYKVIFIWNYPADKKTRKKWSRAVEKSMKTFKLIDTEEAPEEVDSMGGYEQILEYHQHDVEQTPGWQLVEVPSKRFLIKTNSDDKKKIQLVIRRLEASRDLYEQDFPPDHEIKAVSVVRLCAKYPDFQQYGGTSPGVAGYFNPGSEELVLYFNPDSGDDFTLAVMSHEGFHQYCHFLFDRSEAHRWFDEGSGDYYGAFKLQGSKLKPDDDMKGGLSRVPEIKQMIKDHTYKPLSQHIRFSHSEWQTQGPSNVSCYAQSFSIIYFLREGARGKVSKKYWKDEYADIIPNYIRTLNDGYQEAYKVVRQETQDQIDLLEEAGEDVPEFLRERLIRPQVGEEAKSKIWAASMGESWGKVDEKEFEERWIAFVEDQM